MEDRKLIMVAAGIVAVALVVLAAAFILLNDNENVAPTPTPAPAATPAPAGTPTATPAPAVATPALAPVGPIVLHAVANRTGGMCFVSIYLNAGASPIDASNLKMDIVCEGRTYSNVSTLRGADWASADGDAMLEPGEAITTQIDTVALGIPQGKELTIRVLRDGIVLQETTVMPA